jgi:hypothetical protein
MKQGVLGFELNDLDKNGLMSTIYELDRSQGLDLMLHTPGGDIAATESLVEYLRSTFEDIRAVVPQLAMSAGTMIALSCRKIVMGKHSSLGPIDPQIGTTPALGILEEWDRALEEARKDPLRGQFWSGITNKYPPGLIGTAEKYRDWSRELAVEWMTTCMFSDLDDAAAHSKADEVLGELGSHSATKAHNRHISANRAREIGLDVVLLEDDQPLQERVLTVHHAFMLTLASQPILKIIENHNGIAFSELYERA